MGLTVWELVEPQVEVGGEIMERVTLLGLRVEKGLTQEELANKVGLSRGSIGKIENGVHRARPSTRRKLCKALDWPYSRHAEIFGELAKPGKRVSKYE